VSDDVRRLSDELAHDPSSLVFLQLGEALRRREQLDLALKVALRGLERHPHNAEAHDLLARIAVDRGELQRAFDEWDMVLRLEPKHGGARKGMGFVCFRQGRLEEAERYLSEAISLDPADTSSEAALANIRKRLDPKKNGGPDDRMPEEASPASSRRVAAAAATLGSSDSSVRASTAIPPPTADAGRREFSRDPRMLFAELLGEEERTALLLDAQGLVLAGAYVSHDGRDVAQEVGAELSGVSEEARRAMRHLGLGDWTSIVFETEVAIVAMAPAPQEGLLLIASSRTTPLGLVTRFLERAVELSRAWLESLR
jgi:tetratricopeptide (TPR) repeat protein